MIRKNELKYVNCLICGESKSVTGLPNHVKHKHGIPPEEYYLKFFKKDDNDGKCLTCGKQMTFKGIFKGYNRFCSNSCIRKNPSIIEKTKQNNLEKYGTEWAISAPQTRRKIEQTTLEHYGVKCNLSSQKIRENIKQTCQEKYGGNAPACNKVVKDKMISTNRERYGVDFYNNIDKTRETNLDRYGVTCTLQAKEVKEKIKKTNLEKYGAENVFASEEVKEKIKNTNIEKYGFEYSIQSKEVQNKCRNTMIKNHGVEYTWQSPKLFKKVVDTKIERYGQNYKVKEREKQKETLLQRYGVENPMQCAEIKAKAKNTNIEKYGAEFYAQTAEFHKNKLTKYWYNNVTFDSSYELCFYRYCLDHNIDIVRNTDSFKYVFHNKTHLYFPDFVVEGEYVEIKGAQFFEDGKMINPYDRSQDAFYEAKHQCMIENGVKIITDCTRYIEYINSIDKNFLDKCSLKRKLNLDCLEWKKLTDGKQRVIDIAKRATGEEFYKRELSFWEQNPEQRKILFENRLKYIHKQPNELSDLEILRGISISGKVRAYSHFDNAGMKKFIEKYNIHSIYDPCAGWGERLITCAALGIEYKGIDINPNVVEGHKRIIKHYNLDKNKYQVYCCDSGSQSTEDNLTNEYDATFTCPPYWNEEIYTDAGAENLSYKEFLDWWKQVIINSNTDLFAYQINQKYKEDMNKVLKDLGYEFIEEIILPQKSSHFTREKNGVNKKKEYESIQVFKLPTAKPRV